MAFSSFKVLGKHIYLIAVAQELHDSSAPSQRTEQLLDAWGPRGTKAMASPANLCVPI